MCKRTLRIEKWESKMKLSKGQKLVEKVKYGGGLGHLSAHSSL